MPDRSDDFRRQAQRNSNVSADAVRELVESGMRLGESGQLDGAAERFRQALDLDPDNAAALGGLGNVAQSQGRLDEAVASYRRALDADPGLGFARGNLGVTLLTQGNYRDGAEALRLACEANPESALLWMHYGNALLSIGELDEAERKFHRALEIVPRSAETRSGLAEILRRRKRNEEAIAEYRRAIEISPDFSAAQLGIGLVLLSTRRFEEAAAALRRAIELAPTHAEARCNLGMAFAALNRVDEAIECYRRALALDPRLAAAPYNLGTLQQSLGRDDEAIDSFRSAIAIRPDYAEAHNNLGNSLLRRGQLLDGWDEIEWRWLCPVLNLGPKERYPRPLWSGEAAPAGASILLWSDTRYGDVIQFVRYAPIVARSGWRVVLGVPHPLKRLVESIPGTIVVAEGEIVPGFHVHCPLTSVPRMLRTTLETIPAAIPYLRPEPRLVDSWRGKLGGLPGTKVGIAWRGAAAHARDPGGSLEPALFARTFEDEELSLVVLQTDATADEVAALRAGGRIFGAGEELTDFAETAALIANLDLVITVDTAICHLAGALGAPVWTLLEHVPDWRWMEGRADSPWYPTMRLFRQTRPKDWDSVVDRVRAELRSFVNDRASPKG